MSVIFVDIVDSSKLINTGIKPSNANLKLVTELFASYDKLISPFGGVRIKTNGDQYIAVVQRQSKSCRKEFFSSILRHLPILKHSKYTRKSTKKNSLSSSELEEKQLENASCYLVYRAFLACYNILSNTTIDIKIGVSYGKVTIGVFDPKHPQIDIWGKPVLLAARLESIAKSKQIVVDHTFFEHLHLHQNEFRKYEKDLKGIGVTSVYSRTFDNEFGV